MKVSAAMDFILMKEKQFGRLLDVETIFKMNCFDIIIFSDKNYTKSLFILLYMCFIDEDCVSVFGLYDQIRYIKTASLPPPLCLYLLTLCI